MKRRIRQAIKQEMNETGEYIDLTTQWDVLKEQAQIKREFGEEALLPYNIQCIRKWQREQGRLAIAARNIAEANGTITHPDYTIRSKPLRPKKDP
ncbi:MAG: hypothetical protein NWE93_06650 [Candidatus Bathyarchaeota archaeon]|nr:hypothetical protein [Candidatus Bathyarchaeota archaeon]